MANATFISEARSLLQTAWNSYIQANPLTANLLTAAPPALPTDGVLSPALRAQILGLISSFPDVALPSVAAGFTWANPGQFGGLVIRRNTTLVWVAPLDDTLILAAGASRLIETSYLA